MEGFDYDVAARTVKIEDITSNETNRNILRQLRENNPDFGRLWVSSRRGTSYYVYFPDEGGRDSGWLGYYIGQNTTLRELTLQSNPFEGSNNAIEALCWGMMVVKGFNCRCRSPAVWRAEQW